MSTTTGIIGLRCLIARTPSRPDGVGQAEVEDDAVTSFDVEFGHGLPEAAGPGEVHARPEGAFEHELHQPGVAVVVLDEQDPHQRGVLGCQRDAAHLGSRTIRSQKPSSERTASMNSVKSTGLEI